ncbi:MAG: NAD(P)H-hydrate dehydratase [Blautia sp.]|nr:NAD(P)H-hydrate dehydratase [Blautia sp.]
MKRIVTGMEMKELDQNTIRQHGIPSAVLMERASLAVAEEIRKRFSPGSRILAVCGSGNNGGDGIASARILHMWGYRVLIFLAGRIEKMTDETGAQYRTAMSYGIPVLSGEDLPEGPFDVVIDALFGVGLAREIEGNYRELISRLNTMEGYKVSVDIPSGIHADHGQVMGTAFKADLTVTFAYRKRGHCLYPGRQLSGEVIVADIGIYEKRNAGVSPDGAVVPQNAEAPGCCMHFQQDDLSLLSGRNEDGNKGTFGKILVAAGSPGMCGAAYMSSRAALLSGIGMVRILTAEENRIPLQTMFPEAMLTCSHEEAELERVFSWCDTVVLGPGLGTSTDSENVCLWLLRNARESKKPLVIDADGLNLLAAHPEWNDYLDTNVILTPHVGEMSRLCGLPAGELKADLPAAAFNYAKSHGCTVVLKDACTVISAPDGRLWLNLSGNSGMATAGSGDVLSGLIGGLVCLGQMKAVCRGAKSCNANLPLLAAGAVYLHGLCGDRAAAEHGKSSMTAVSLLAEIGYFLE